MRRLRPRARQDHADILENRGDRRVRLVNGDLDRADARKCPKYRVGDGAGRAFQQLIIGIFKGRGRSRDHVGIGYGVGEAVAARGFRQVGEEFEIDHETLPDLGFMFHDAMAGMDDNARDEDTVRHRLSQIAAATRNACTVSDTSWVRMICAPPLAAITCAAIEPPSRSRGCDGATEAMKRLREAPPGGGRPSERSSSSRASAIILCSGVLPKPIPGSSTIS